MKDDGSRPALGGRLSTGIGRSRLARSQRRWVRVRALTAQERAEIAAACGRFIEVTLKPRFLPEVRPTSFNYPIDNFGKWRGSKYLAALSTTAAQAAHFAALQVRFGGRRNFMKLLER